jgi:hypothetical protein
MKRDQQIEAARQAHVKRFGHETYGLVGNEKAVVDAYYEGRK